ncbi:MAG: thioredoxin family protein [Roseburia sp.]|nr:thioredoxin family protein [Roseburia sp.]
MVVEVVGRGCNDYFAILDEVNRFASKKHDVEVVEVSDGAKIAKYGLNMLPALLVNGTVRWQGVGVKKEEVKTMLAG